MPGTGLEHVFKMFSISPGQSLFTSSYYTLFIQSEGFGFDEKFTVQKKICQKLRDLQERENVPPGI